MPKLFLSYRRADAHPDVQKVVDGLTRTHGAQSFVRDLQSLAAGEAYREMVKSAMRDCVGAIIVAGPEFTSQPDALGRRRLDNPDDPLRIEIETALKVQKMMLVVAFVGGAEMPLPTDLPRSLRPITRRGAIQMGAVESFDADSGYLNEAARKMLDGSARRAVRNITIIFLLITLGTLIFVVLSSAQMSSVPLP